MKQIQFLILFTIFSSTAFAAGSGGHSHGESHGHEGAQFGVGQPFNGKPDRTVMVSMLDTMRFEFSPELTDLHQGEVIKFVVKNDGSIVHEFSIGNSEEQMQHAEMMRKMPNMMHKDPNTVSLKPGEVANLTWRFMGKDKVVFACNIPGHFEAGMHHDIAIDSQ